MDPHGAVAYAGLKKYRQQIRDEVIGFTLATAHPAKFPDAVNKAIGKDPDRPASLNGLEKRDKRCEIIEADTVKVKEFLASRALQSE